VRLEQALREDTNALRRATIDVEAAEASALKAQRMAEVGQQAFALSRRQFELGLISAIEYQTASQAFLKAQVESLNAQLQLRLKRHLLRYRQTGNL
jgi:outer membrane protein TolC